MTLDVTIGKIIFSEPDPEWDETYTVYVDVEQCPDIDYDLCKSPELTLWPRSAYRSGSTGFWKFFELKTGNLYYKMRDHPGSNDRDVCRIKPIIDQINQLPDKTGTDIDDDRMKWLKFWCNRAIELYGDLAGVMFT